MTSKRRTSQIMWLLAAVICVTVVVLFRSVAVEATYPVGHAKRLFVQEVWSRVKGLFRGASVAAENERLRRENAALSVLRVDIDRLEVENARLRRALDSFGKNRATWLAAGVLSHGGAAGVRELIRVDKGSLAGVREGAVAVVPEGIIGRVTAVTPHTAEITLVTDSSIKVACEIEGASSGVMRGILSGGTDDVLLLRHISGGVRVPPRARVLTSGRGGEFPRGLVVGTVLSVTNGVRGIEAEVSAAIDYSTLEDVFIRRAQ